MPYPLEIHLLGGCELLLDGIAVTPLRQRKEVLLLAMLTLSQGKGIDREFLASIFWSDSMQAQAYYNLRRTLVSLRKLFGTQADRISTPTTRTVRLDLSGAYSDVEAFDQAVARPDIESLRKAIALYRGPLLHEYSEDWLVDAREARHTAYVKALLAVGEDCESRGAHSEAVRLMRHAVAMEPWDESLQRGLMRSLAANGEIAAATAVYRDLSDFLYRELNAQPDPATKALLEQIRSQARAAPASPAAITAPVSSPGVSNPPIAPRLEALTTPAAPSSGAVPLASPYYLARREDAEFLHALRSGESIILIKGARQTGMTSLLARGLENARNGGASVVHVDLEMYAPEQMATVDSLCYALAQELADQLELAVSPESIWSLDLSASRKLERYLRQHALIPLENRLVWAIDSVDALIGRDYSTSIFGLFRSWHNRRALDPAGPWLKLTLVLLYRTEAHLLIPVRHQSPFNVGYTVTLGDFTREQVRDLNVRYGCPLTGEPQIARYYQLLSGHPYLSALGLAILRSGSMTLPELMAESNRDEGPFGSHLRQMLADLRRNPELLAAVKCILSHTAPISSSDFYRLRTAGIVTGPSAESLTMRCSLYQSYLMRHLAP